MTFTFDEASHTYRLASGHAVPSVTSLLADLDDGYRYVKDSAMEHARVRGTAVHRACELHDLGTLDEGSVHEEVRPYLTAYRAFLAETGFRPTLIEKRMVHPSMGYAGTLDRTGTMHGKHLLLDLKAVAVISPATAVQTSAYLELHRSNGLEQTPQERRALQLLPNGRYVLTPPYTGLDDFRVFLALKTIDNWRRK